MSKEQFETVLRQFLDRKPFQPFIVDLKDGRRVTVRRPPVVFSDGAASFIDPVDGALVDFSHDEVRAFGYWEQEVPA